MNLASIFHKANDSYAYAYDNAHIHIRIHTGKNEVRQIELISGDPYDFIDGNWNYQKQSMHKIGSCSRYDYWQIKIKPAFKRLRYGFLLSDSQDEILFTEKGFFTKIPTGNVAYYFNFPYLHATEVFHGPDWVKSTVWYEIFPDRFAKAQQTTKQPLTVWGEVPTRTNFFGGNFRGVMERLDHLSDLGITGIYFAPIFLAPSNHKYDTMNYFEIDPLFGTKTDFQALVQQCHARGIRIMLDCVFNHCGYQFAPFQDVLKHGQDSKYQDWFHIDWQRTEETGTLQYECFGFYPIQPKLNTQNEEVQHHLLDAATYWTKEFAIDAWRLDVANEVDHAFWRTFKKQIQTINPKIYILGEIWHDATPWLDGTQFHGVMSYPFTFYALQCIAHEKISVRAFEEHINELLFAQPETIRPFTFHLLDSHDTIRLATACENQEEKIMLLLVLLLTFYGCPAIYYGTEIGLEGGEDPDCRRCMIWEEKQQNRTIYQHTKKLIQLRKTYPTLANDGNFRFVSHNFRHVLMYERKSSTETWRIILNVSADMVNMKILGEVMYKDIRTIISHEKVRISSYGFLLVRY